MRDAARVSAGVILVALGMLRAASGNAQESRPVIAPGAHVRLWIGSAHTPITGRVLESRDGSLRLDEGALTCGAGGCGPTHVELATVTRAQEMRRSALALVPVALGAGFAAPMLASRRCSRSDNANNVRCEAVYFASGAVIVGFTYLLAKSRWRDLPLSPVH